MTNSLSRQYNFKTQDETENFAATLSLWARPGCLIALQGDLGAGKSTFARAFIRALATTNQDFDVPSPSFSLVQQYENTRIPVAHVDLYRLNSSEDVLELGISDLLETHIVLVEWPDKLPSLTAAKLRLSFSGAGDVRELHLEAEGDWATAISRNEDIEKFLASTLWKNQRRKFLEGDASSRRYETVALNGVTSIVMDMPRKPDGPPVLNGKPYSAIAHLAEDINAVINANQVLKAQGYSAPKIEASDTSKGFAVIENLGNSVFGNMTRSGQDMTEPMQAAVTVLADIAGKTWPNNIPPYDVSAQLIETDLLISWFWPFINGSKPERELHESFAAVWNEILPKTVAQKPVWVLRDFHSPNLIWMPHRLGLQRVGLIDTQDAVLGHPAYDLASLLQDARVDIDFSFADKLYAYYEGLRSQNAPFDEHEFAEAYAILGAQRATKILGIFARLAKRDAKPAYLKHMPRVSRYLKRSLEHPVLGKLKDWYLVNMPEALDVRHK